LLERLLPDVGLNGFAAAARRTTSC
jgi:hypothetical protein